MKAYLLLGLFLTGLFAGGTGMHWKHGNDEKKRLEAEIEATKDLSDRQYDVEKENAENNQLLNESAREVTREVIRYVPTSYMSGEWVRIHNCATGNAATPCELDGAPETTPSD